MPPLPQTIQVRDRIVTFVARAGAASELALTEFETAYVSTRGDHCVVYDRTAGTGRVLDLHGGQVGALAAEERYAALAVSNSGLVAAWTPITMRPGARQDLRLFDATGQELWSMADRFEAYSLRVEFSPDGELLAVLGLEHVEKGEPHAVGMLLDGGGERWSHDFGAGLQIGDVAFGHRGRRMAFALYSRDEAGRETNHVLVSDARDGLIDIPCRELGQIITSGGIAFLSDDEHIVINGLGTVQMYEIKSGNRRWSVRLNASDRVEDLLDTAVKLAVVGGRIIAAHRVSAPNGRVRYALTVLDRNGRVLTRHVVPEPQPRRAQVGRFWDFRDNGRAVELYVEPAPVVVKLP